MIQNNVLLGVLKKWISRRVIATIGPDDLPAPPFIITANHTSYFDHFVLAWWLLCKGLPYPRFLSKAELFERPISRWFNHYGGGIPIARDKVDTEAFELTRQTLNDGGIIIMYAEGTRSRDGWLRIPHRGIASLAAQAGVPVIPVGLFGVNHVLPIGARWPKRKRRIVIYNGATLMPPEPDKEKEKNFALRIYEQIAMLTAQWPEFLSDFTPSKEMNWPQLDSPIREAHDAVELGFHADESTALSSFRQAIHLVRGLGNPYAVLVRGQAYGQLARRSHHPFSQLYYALKSSHALWKAVRRIPDYPPAWHAFAVLMEQLPTWLGGDPLLAQSAHRIACGLDSKWPRGLIYVSRLYRRLGRYGEADRWLTYLIHQIEFTPNDELRRAQALDLWNEWHPVHREIATGAETEESK